MGEISEATGRNYRPFDYYGAPDAENIIIAMGSVTETVKGVIDLLAKQGKKVGLMVVRLYRPFSAKYFFKALPKSVKKIAVLDRCKEPGAIGEPLYVDIKALFQDQENAPVIVGGRYGLSSKDTTPAQIIAVYENLEAKEPKNNFTIGIVDDVTFLSLPQKEEISIVKEGTTECRFYGLGSDGTVGANKNTIKIIGNNTPLYCQAYFDYDSKKSGGYTCSHLRFGKEPIHAPYLVNTPDFVACHVPSYLEKYDVLNGAFGIVMDVNSGEIKGMSTLGSYDPNNYLNCVKGFEKEPEGGARCLKCFEMRLLKTVCYAKEHGYDAAFIGTGAGLPKFMNIEGENLIGVFSANEYLTRANLMKAYDTDKACTPLYKAKHVVVVGGGNVAMDAARMGYRLGADVVDIVYRRTKAEMPARREEVAHAEEEGVNFRFLENPVKINGDENGRVKSVTVLSYELGEPDASGRRRPVAVEGSEYDIPVDCVIMSIGTSPNPLIKSTTEGLETEKHGCIVADENGKTYAMYAIYEYSSIDGYKVNYY